MDASENKTGKVVCYSCNVPITDKNKSTEHIILNACGGKLKSDKLLCKDCNSLFGTRFDSHLAKSTNALANLLMINREKGKPQPIKTQNSTTKEPYYLDLGGKPIPARPKIRHYEKDGQKRLDITAHSTEALIKVLKGLKRKYPNLDMDGALKAAKSRKVMEDGSYDIDGSIGGQEVFRAIAKSIINFYIHRKGHVRFIKPLIPYLLGKDEMDVVWMHYPDQPIYEPDTGEVSHVLKVVGSAKERILYGYMELFNTHCFIVKLSSDYYGEDFNADYVYEVLSEKVLDKKPELALTRAELHDLFQNKEAKPFENIQKRYARVINIAYRVQDKHQLGVILEEAIEEVLGKFPEDEPLDAKALKALNAEVAESVALFFKSKRRGRSSSS